MRNYYLCLSTAVVLTGCASAPYVPAEDISSVGYSETLVAPSTYYVTYTSGRFATPQAAERQLLRRAGEVCKGRFTELADDLKYVIIRSCDSHPWSPCRDIFVQVLVRCGDSQ